MVEENPSTHTRSLANRIGRNLSASFVARFSSSLHRVAIVPLFIWFLGPPRYGEWLVLSAIPSWLTLSNISLGSVAGNAIALRVAEGRLVDARRAYSSALAAITGLSLCGLGIVFATACYFAAAPIATGGGGLSADSLTAILLLSASILVSFFAELFTTRLRAVGKAHVGIGLSATLPWLEAGFSALALWVQPTQPTFTSLAAAILASRVVYNCIAWASSRHAHPELYFCRQDVHAAEMPALLQKGLAYQAFPLGHALVNQGLLLVVNAVLGPIAVVVFGTARTLARIGTQIMEVINHSIWPEMSLLLGGGHLQQATAVHRAAVASTLATGFASVAFAALLGPWIFGVWTLHRLPPVTHSLMAIFALSILAQSMWHASFFVHLAANKHEGAALRFVAGAILAVALCYPLAKIGGLYGAAGSPLILDALMIPHTVCTALQMTGDTLPGFLAGLVPAAWAGVCRVCSTVHRLAGF